tara:strand:+ start:505 stop:912 length:408 start_codon:yes stop_codon:yes gene_type:complete
MKSKTFLEFLPINFRHEKSFLIENKLLDFNKLSNLSDKEINKILRDYPLCTLNNLKKIRAIAIFNKEISISPHEAYLLLHCGVGSIKTLSRLTAHELKQKIGRLERSLRVKSETNITLTVLKRWIEKSKRNNKSI